MHILLGRQDELDYILCFDDASKVVLDIGCLLSQVRYYNSLVC